MIKRTIAVLIVCCVMAPISRGDMWEDFANYHYNGKATSDDHVAKKVEILVQETPVEKYGQLEQKLIAVVSSGESTQTAKALSCRFLQQVGSQKCIPAVSQLLTDEVLSHYARLTLERLKCEEADRELREALPKAPDQVKPGIMNSVGNRGDEKAVTAVSKLAKSDNSSVASAAIKALGMIGGKQAADALVALSPSKDLIPVKMQAMAKCAETLEGDEAVSLCQKVLDGGYNPPRIAAITILAEKDASKAYPVIAGAIKGEDAGLRKGVLGIIASTEGAELTKRLTGLLEDLPQAPKSQLVRALGSRGDKAALPGITELIKSDQDVVREASIDALGKLGDGSTVKVLLGMADSPKLKESVAKAITGMTGDDIDHALIEALGNSKIRKPAINVLVARGTGAAVPELLKLTSANDADIRQLAWDAVGNLGRGGDIEPMIKAITGLKNKADLGNAGSALRKVFARAEGKDKNFQIIAGYYEKVPGGIKNVIIELGPVAGGEEALAMERKVLKSGQEEQADKALRAIAKWPNKLAAPDLLELAKSASDKTDRILALRGYIRIAGLEDAKLTGEERVEMFKKAMKVADRTAEKKRIVSGLRSAKSIESLDMLAELMENPELATEAEMSAANLVWELRMHNAQRAKAMAEKLKDSKNKIVAKKAKETLADLAESQAYIRDWSVSDVYEDGNMKAVFEKLYPPEKDDKKATWKPLVKGVNKKEIDLNKAVGANGNCCVYVKTTLDCPQSQEVRLELGSDDAIKVWLNGKLVHANFVTRGVKPGQDKVAAGLKKGKNTLMMKIVQGNGGWGFSCRIKDKDGMPVDGLKVSN